ncbi:MAG: glycosyltransferase family 4 protein [Paraprevotella clara]|uniref:Glycogen synthase n=1 Tax=Paraprevotella clara TaxID=454154 RepID=A0A6N3GV46_9BACT
MKVLLIDIYNFNKGGAETVCFNTGKLLEEYGHKVVYFTLKWPQNKPSPFSKYFPESKETRDGPLRQVRNLINYFYHFEAAKKIEQLILDEKPDLAHIHLMWGQITPSIFPVLKKYHIPILFTVHDYRMVCPAYTFRDGSGRVCEVCQGRYFYKCFAHACCKGNKLMSAVMAAEQYFRNAFFNPAKFINGFIYVSNFARNIQEKYMPALKEKPNITLYNFSTSIVNRPKEMSTEKYFLFFGRLSYEKGVMTLLRSFKDIPHCFLKVVGTGPQKGELKAFAKDNGMQNVAFLGYKTGTELTDLVINAYFVIVPSEWYENNPMTVIEAYSVGTPVIGARIGGIPEIVVNGQTGFLFESGNVEDLHRVIRQAYNLDGKAYTALSCGTIDFANRNLSKKSYWAKLIKFYKLFVDNEK